MDERMNSIPAPVDGGFEWVFGDASRQVGGLLEWFTNTRGEEIYWLTGASLPLAIPLFDP
jgi:hypothetical protein